jgi:hypothetical protein
LKNKFWSNLGKGVSWMFLTTMFGLLQLWLILGHNLVVKEDILTYNQVLLDGFLLFFITAIVSTISVDFFLSDLVFSRIIVGLLFVLYPLVIMLMCVGLFYIGLDKSPIELELNTIEAVQFTLITMTIIYAISTKTLKFYHS